MYLMHVDVNGIDLDSSKTLRQSVYLFDFFLHLHVFASTQGGSCYQLSWLDGDGFDW